jgi:uncharacterized protein YjbI with pentapeptide repeats
MVDMARVDPDTETPVNPYSLLEAVNSSSDTSHTGWLLFLAVMTYLVIAVAGVTHEALLLETPVQLPILQVKIQLKQFFQFAPIVLVLFHLGILAQLVLLARKTLEFDHAIRLLETSARRSHPLRLELHNFFFVQAIAGPQRSVVMSGFLNLMSWLTLIILPVILLLYMQVAFLPYHDVTTTWITRVAVLVDIVLVLLIGVFLLRPEPSFFQAFWRSAAAHPFGSIATTSLLMLVAYMSLFAATVPGEDLDRAGRHLVWGADRDTGKRAQQAGFVLPFLSARADGTLFGIFRRNIVVTDSDLIVENKAEGGDKRLKLRGRDLRYAKLDRTDLHGADLTGAALDGSSLVGVNLDDAWLNCAEMDRLLLNDDRAAAGCASAQGADLSHAQLGNAHMAGIDLRGAKLDEAQLDGVDLSNASLVGASFSSAHLEKADLTGGVDAQGANFLNAALQGADLTGAELQSSDLSSASLQGTVLNFAHLEGAVMRGADLEAASLQRAHLQGADLTGVKIAGADLRGVGVWLTTAPEWNPAGLTDISEVVIKTPDEAALAELKGKIQGIVDDELRVRVAEAVAPLLGGSANWQGSADQQRWQSLTTAPAPQPVTTSAIPGMPPPAPTDSYKTDLTTYLTKMMCSARWSNGSVATGVARRAVAQQFRGDVVALYDGLKSNACPASAKMPTKVMRDLSSAAETARYR